MAGLPGRVDALLRDGLRRGLFTAAAVAVRTPAETFVQSYGHPAEDDPSSVDGRSLFDLASVTKTFTACAIVHLIEEGVVDPDAPVASILSVGSGPGAERITLRMLLTHTSGLPEESTVWRGAADPRPDALERVVRTPIDSLPGTEYRYSCVGYVAAGAVAEAVTGLSIGDLIRHRVIEPLGLSDTGFGPVDPGRAVATEDQTAIGRGLLRGTVHDELAWYLGGAAGNAGLFATVEDVARFAEEFRDPRVFGRDVHALMTSSWLDPELRTPFGQGAGSRIGDPDYMADAHSFGHTGFTGTMWVVDPGRAASTVLLTNRVHPHRDGVDLMPFRRALTEIVAH